MTGTYHFGDSYSSVSGDSIVVSGDHNVVNANKQTVTADPQATYRDLVEAVRVLQGRVEAPDRRVLEDALDAIGKPEAAQRPILRRALGSIVGVATMVGDAGVPVVAAVRKVMAAFGA